MVYFPLKHSCLYNNNFVFVRKVLFTFSYLEIYLSPFREFVYTSQDPKDQLLLGYFLLIQFVCLFDFSESVIIHNPKKGNRREKKPSRISFENKDANFLLTFLYMLCLKCNFLIHLSSNTINSFKKHGTSFLWYNFAVHLQTSLCHTQSSGQSWTQAGEH